MDIAMVTSKGQITVPKEVREKLNLEPGSKVVFLQVGDDVIVRNADVDVKRRSDISKQAFLAEAAAKYDIAPEALGSLSRTKSSSELLDEIRAGFRAVIEEHGLTTDQEIAKYFGLDEDELEV